MLDADFFQYPPSVKAKIYDTFKFMHLHGLSKRGWRARSAHRSLLELSETLHSLLPNLERRVFTILEQGAALIGKGSQ